MCEVWPLLLVRNLLFNVVVSQFQIAKLRVNNDSLGAGRRSCKPRQVRCFERFRKTGGLEDVVCLKVSVDY
jgi:hypothetical protein